MNRFLPLLLAAGSLFAPGAWAQPSLLDPTTLDDLFDEEALVEVNLQGSLLRLAAEATREDEPETAALIDGLDAITVRVYPLSSAAEGLSDGLGDLGRQLESGGWHTLVRVRDGGEAASEQPGEDVWVYVRDEGDVFGGLVVMALDPSEDQAAFVVIDGRIEPDQIGRLSSRFGDLDLDWDDEEDGEDPDEGYEEEEDPGEEEN